jgi:hypothetical protein
MLGRVGCSQPLAWDSLLIFQVRLGAVKGRCAGWKSLRTGKHCNHRMNMKRMRGRSHRSGGGGGNGGGGSSPRQYGGNIPLNRNHVFDSSGPDLRIRGTAQQLFEKYLQLGRDATGSGDRVMAESYFQYAEHYFRILNAINQAAQQQNGGQGNGQQHQGGGGQQGQQYNGHQRRDRDGNETEEPQPPMANGPQPQPGFGDQPGIDTPVAEEAVR